MKEEKKKWMNLVNRDKYGDARADSGERQRRWQNVKEEKKRWMNTLQGRQCGEFLLTNSYQ